MQHTLTALLTWIALFSGHQFADYLSQTDYMATTKGEARGEGTWKGRIACSAHAAHHAAAYVAALAALFGTTGTPAPVGRLSGAVTLAVVSHWVVDRRWTLKAVCHAIGKGEFYDNGGAPLLDQASHMVFIFLAALVAAS